MCGAVLAAICLSSAFDALALGCPLWPFDRDRRAMLVGGPVFGDDAPAKMRGGFLATISDPYLLDGLVASDLVAGFETPSRALWIDWYHLGHSLYHEDRVVVGIGCLLPAWGISFNAVPALMRRAVEGFAAEESSSLDLAVSYARGRGGSAGFVRSVYESDDRAGAYAAIFVSLRAGSLLARLDRVVSGVRSGDSRVLLEAVLNENLALVSGYRWNSGEISSGIMFELSRVTLDLLWSENPALGSTISAGVGRWWR
jgi:hypothetical protein